MTPADPGQRALDAEHHLAGCAAISQHGALLASRLDAEAFYDPLAWRVITAGAALPDSAGPDVHPIEARIRAIADTVGMHVAVLRSWVDSTPVQWDHTGALATRVLAGAARRARIAKHVSALEAEGVTVRWPAT